MIRIDMIVLLKNYHDIVFLLLIIFIFFCWILFQIFFNFYKKDNAIYYELFTTKANPFVLITMVQIVILFIILIPVLELEPASAEESVDSGFNYWEIIDSEAPVDTGFNYWEDSESFYSEGPVYSRSNYWEPIPINSERIPINSERIPINSDGAITMLLVDSSGPIPINSSGPAQGSNWNWYRLILNIWSLLVSWPKWGV